jgi:hypothetical protein
MSATRLTRVLSCFRETRSDDGSDSLRQMNAGSQVPLASQKNVVKHVFRRYIEAVYLYLSRSEARLVRGWPDKRDDVRTAFRIQELINRRTELRFEYLLKEHDVRDVIWTSFRSVSSICDRIHDAWTRGEEVELRQSNAAYEKLIAEIETMQRMADPRALDGPFRDAQRDGDYLNARRAMQDVVHELDNALSHS